MPALRFRFRRSPLAIVAFAALFAIFAAVAFGDTSKLFCGVEATHGISAFCYRTTVTVSKTEVGALTDYPIAITIDGRQMVTSQSMNASGHDFMPVDAGSTAIDGGMAEGIIAGSDPTTTWWLFGDVAAGDGADAAETAFFIYTGANDTYRDQGIQFSTNCGALAPPCSDTVTVTDHASLDVIDNFDVLLTIQATTSDQNGTLVDKLDSTSGYRLEVASGHLIGTMGNGAATSSLSAAWDGTKTRLRMRFDAGAANDLAIAYLATSTDAWVIQASMDTGYSSIATNAADLIIGNGYDGLITEVELRDGVGCCYAKVFHLGFNPVDLAETTTGTAGNGWVYSGTVADLYASHNGVYRFVRDQSLFQVRLGAIGFTTAAAALNVGVKLPDVFGALADTDLSATSSPYKSLGLFGDVLDTAVGGTSLPSVAFLFMITLIVGVGLSSLVFLISDRNETVAAFTMIAVFGISAAVGIIPGWWAVVPGVVVFTAWLLIARSRGGGAA